MKLDLELGESMQAYLSISVTDDRDILPDTTKNIMTLLLLSSELKGHIESPSYYFQENNRKASVALDMLMMTQGWRRYNIPNVLKGDIVYPKNAIENELKITGKVKSLVRGKPIQQGVIMLYTSEAQPSIYKTLTSEQGTFTFSGIDLADSLQCVIQATNKKD